MIRTHAASAEAEPGCSRAPRPFLAAGREATRSRISGLVSSAGQDAARDGVSSAGVMPIRATRNTKRLEDAAAVSHADYYSAIVLRALG